MIASTLIAVTVAAAQPATAPQPAVAPAPTAEKKMACCEDMAKGEGCACCKGMDHKTTSAPAADGHDGHAGHDH